MPSKGVLLAPCAQTSAARAIFCTNAPQSRRGPAGCAAPRRAPAAPGRGCPSAGAGLQTKKPRTKVRGMQDLFSRLDSARYLTGTQAAGAGVDITGRPVHYRFHSSHVGLPSSVRTSVRMRNLDTESNILATNITFCHESAPPLTGLSKLQQ